MDTLPPIDDSILNDNEIKSQGEPEYQPQYVYVQPPQQPAWEHPEQISKKDIFSDLDKTAYIIIFAAFILGFFMGKTMQPVILRNH
tara:strand:- start:7503 stop:7760 length:258 start_codon:yes stop_codon:yes gene_type:complete